MAIPTSKYKDISFSTQFEYAKTKLKSNLDFSLATWEFKTVSIYHGLGYKPYFRLFIRLPNSPLFLHMTTGPTTYGFWGDQQVEGIGADNNYIYVNFGNYGYAAGVGTIYYRIYEDAQ